MVKKCMSTIKNRLQRVKNFICQAEYDTHRSQNSVALVAVSKSYPISDVLIAYQAGQRHFAENYLQEALPKIQATEELDITWHFIGTIQSKKAAIIARQFSWVQSVDRFTIAMALNTARAHMPPLNICIQVNVDREASKSGVLLAELPALAAAIQTLPNLKLRGLMCLPASSKETDIQRNSFSLCQKAFTDLKKELPFIDTLSMGMSESLGSAIAEYSTMVRVGTAIFGPRDPNLKYRPSPPESSKL